MRTLAKFIFFASTSYWLFFLLSPDFIPELGFVSELIGGIILLISYIIMAVLIYKEKLKWILF